MLMLPYQQCQINFFISSKICSKIYHLGTMYNVCLTKQTRMRHSNINIVWYTPRHSNINIVWYTPRNRNINIVWYTPRHSNINTVQSQCIHIPSDIAMSIVYSVSVCNAYTLGHSNVNSANRQICLLIHKLCFPCNINRNTINNKHWPKICRLLPYQQCQ